MAKCNAKTEVYSRVCGYFRPVSNWNKGKKEEFKERKTYKIGPISPIGPMKLAVAAVFAALLLSGCKATETLAQGITTKNVSGNGTVIDSRIGIDPETKIPGLKTVFISGDFATVKAGTNQVSYREESSASVWNASSITKKRFLAITLTDTGDVPMAIRAVAEVFKTAEENGAESANNKTYKTYKTYRKSAGTEAETREPKTDAETKTAEVQKAAEVKK